MSSREPCFTKMPNYILEGLIRIRLTAREICVLLTVIRLTIGYHKEEAMLSNSEIANFSKIDKSTIAKLVTRLIERKILTEVAPPDFSNGRIVSLNLRVEEWQEEVSTVGSASTPTVGSASTPTVGSASTPTYYNKENIKKITKESRKVNENFEKKKTSYDIELFKKMLNRDD